MRYLSQRTKLPRWRLTHALRAYFQIRGNFLFTFFHFHFLPSLNGNWLVLGKRALKAPQECFILGYRWRRVAVLCATHAIFFLNVKTCRIVLTDVPHLIHHLVNFRLDLICLFIFLHKQNAVEKKKCNICTHVGFIHFRKTFTPLSSKILIYWLMILKCQIAIKSTKIHSLQPECMQVLGVTFEKYVFRYFWVIKLFSNFIWHEQNMAFMKGQNVTLHCKI